MTEAPETSHDLARHITGIVVAHVGEAEASYLRGLHLPQVFAGHRVDSGATASLASTLSLLIELGETDINGVDLTEATIALLDHVEPDATEAFASFTVGEVALRLGGLAAVRDPSAVVRATRTPETVVRAREGALPPNWLVVVARCLLAEAALTGEQPVEQEEFVERVRELFSASTGWINDGLGDLDMYDAYTADMYLFAEPLADAIGAAWRTGLSAVLHDLDSLSQRGGAIVWGRSIGALGLALTPELAALATREGLADRLDVWLERAREAVDTLDGWFRGGLITAHQHRAEMFYRGPERRLQMTFDVLDKLLKAAIWMRAGAPAPLAPTRDAWPPADRLVGFDETGASSAWTYRSHALSFVLPVMRGWSTDYLPSPRGPGLFEWPTSGHPCFLPTLRAGDATLVPAGVAVDVVHEPGELRVEHVGWAPPGATASAEHSLGGRRRATYRIEGRTLRVDEELDLDGAALVAADSLSILVPEIAARPLTVTVDGIDTVVQSIDTSGIAEWRSFWSEITTVHQFEIPLATDIRFTWRARPQLRVASTILFHDYDQALYAPLAGRLLVSQAPWPAPELAEALLDVDVLHIAWPEWWSGTDPVRTAEAIETLKASGVKIVWTLHNLLPHQFKTEEAAASYQLWAQAADGAIHHSEWGKAEALATYEFGRDTLHAVLPHGHWGARYREMHGAREEIEREYGLTPCAIRLAVIGAPRAEKDLQLVLDGFHACRRDDMQLIIRVAGDERIPDDPRIRIDDEPLDEQDYVRRMGAVDALIMPFAPHGMLTTGTAFDAIGAGIAPITSDWGFLDEVFAGHDIRYGSSASDLTRCLEALTVEQIDASRDGMVALQPAFAWEAIAARHLEFIEAVSDR
jgi:hypothetical protein